MPGLKPRPTRSALGRRKAAPHIGPTRPGFRAYNFFT